MIDFDVGAAVIARHGSDPLVDVHSTGDCPEDALAQARERCLALFRVVRGGTLRAQDAAAVWGPSLLKSSLHVPLASEGSVVGVTLLARLRPDAFSREDEDALRELATHTSGAYRRLEGSVRRLRLTPRQSQVLALIASGLSDREVADRLGLAHRTAHTHLDRLLREHGLHGRTEAVAAWLRGEQG
jgi:DNA-binding CsgD family transcriptional regulator